MRRQDWSPKRRTGWIVVSRSALRGTRNAERYLVRVDDRGRSAVWTKNVVRAKFFPEYDAASSASRSAGPSSTVWFVRDGKIRVRW